MAAAGCSAASLRPLLRSPPVRTAPSSRCPVFTHPASRPRFLSTSRHLQHDAATVIVQRGSRRPRSLRGYIWASSFLLVGLASGQFVRAVVVPPPLPVPESEEDLVLRAKVRKDVDQLPIVQELRAQRAAWLEYEAYMDKPEAARASSMTAGTMAGARGLGVQRVFWNKSEQRLLAVVFLGGGITGWPGVTHGGAVATVLLENLERAANGPEVYPEQDQGKHRLDSFDLNYKKPTTANRVYVVRAEVEKGEPIRDSQNPLVAEHVRVKATIEDALSGRVTAEATGRCTVGPIKWTQEEAASLWSKGMKMIWS